MAKGLGVAAMLAALGLVSAPTGSQAREKQDPDTNKKPVQFEARVAVVAVPVYVVDKKGSAVGGLTAADFEVYDEGKRMSVVGFHEVDVDDPSTLPRSERAAPVAHRQFLFLFDLSFADPGGLARSRSAAIDFVQNKLAPTDLASVATFSATRGVTLLLGFTSDRKQLASAIEGLGLLDQQRAADQLNLVYNVEELPISTTVDSEQSRREIKDAAIMEELRELQVGYQRAHEAQYRQKVEVLIEGFEQLARAMRALQGRVQVLYFSSGFHESILTGALGEDHVRSSEAVVEGRLWEVDSDSYFGDAKVRSYLDRVMKTLAAADVVVHSLDVTGMSDGPQAGNISRTQRATAGTESLHQIAALSGGIFVKDVNDVSVGLQEILNATRRYYLIVFEAPETGKAGRLHNLKVKAGRSGLRVSHRTGYYERETFAQQTPLARQLGTAEALTKSGLVGEIAMHVLAVPYRDPSGQLLLPVVLEMGADLLPAEASGGSLPLEIHGYAFDAKGTVEDVVSVNATLDLSRIGPRVRQHGLQAHAIFTLPPGHHELRFLVREGISGRRGVHWLDVEVPAFGDDMVLYPALFMADPEQWVILPAKSRATRSPGYPFHVADENFTPSLGARLRNGRTDRVCILFYTGDRAYDGSANFEIGAQLFDPSGNAVRIGRVQLLGQAAETDGFRRVVLNVTPDSVPQGDYMLRIRVKDPASGRSNEAEQPIRVE
jgi:VWFA-related protein